MSNQPEMNTPKMIGLSDARLLMSGRDGGYPSTDTLRRWADKTKGCKPAGRRGPTIYLQAIVRHGEMLTCAEWVAEFERQRQLIGEGSAVGA